ncbi:MAG: NAD-dependent epimerase/dehydratase family protein [Hydrogenophaga sp.]|nr:NAD-dependent epimerase/dehydratase family protein [Hydrogenophaga sp.]
MAEPHTASSSSSSGSGLHTVLGAGGVIARELSLELARQGRQVRQVGRLPAAVQASDQLKTANLLDARATAEAVAGSEVVYLVAGLAYDAAVWQAQWPRVMQNTIDACRRHGARLVFFDNVYAYGRVGGAMTEDTPFNPCSRKGEVRAAIASTLLDAMRRGELQAPIARSADFYGPGARLSLLEAVFFARLRAGKAPQWVGNPDLAHTFTFTPDAGRALAALGQAPEAFGQTWHLPTAQSLDGAAVTGRALARAVCALAGQPDRLQVAPAWLLHAMGWFVSVLRENREMMYQYQHGYRFESGKIEQAFGLRPTPYSEGLARTWRSAA